MRTLIALTAAFGFAGAALAADAPTPDQCKGGWKSDYSKTWTKADFKKACKDLMKSGNKM